jgi:diacylglycerol kinase (ATP)
VARGILDAGTDTRLALLAGGTGNDLAKNVGAPADDVPATLDLAFDGPDRLIDVGYVNDTPFVNSCGVGFDVAVIQALPRGGSPLGKSAYLLTAARKLWRYRGISVDGKTYLVIVIGSGAQFGGGMLLAPGAQNDDGLLDFVAVRDMGSLARVRTLLAASRGWHIGLPGVETKRAASFELRFEQPPLFEVDGELVQADRPTLVVRCEKQRLRVCAPEKR